MKTLSLCPISTSTSKVEAPKDYAGLGTALLASRKGIAEEGSLHETARR